MDSRTAVVIGLGGLALAACAGGDPSCGERWQVLARWDVAAEATISDGDMVMSAEVSGYGATLWVVQRALAGDFDIAVPFTDLDTAGDGTYLAVLVSSPTDTTEQAGVTFTETSTGMYLRAYTPDGPSDDADSPGLEARSGSIALVRTAGGMQIQAGDGAAEVALDLPWAVDPFDLYIFMGSSSTAAQPGAPIQARFPEVSIVEGGDVARSDAFDCDTLAPIDIQD